MSNLPTTPAPAASSAASPPLSAAAAARLGLPLACGFTVLVDQREKLPFQFQNLFASAKHGKRPLEITVRACNLPTGDYSVDGLHLPPENRKWIPQPPRGIAIERKSLTDLYNTLGQHRQRFERELVRLNAYAFAAVVVEADWLTVLQSPPERSQLLPKTIYRSVIAWQQRYVNVHWWFASNRRFAEVTTYRLLEMFWRTHGRSGERGEGRKETAS